MTREQQISHGMAFIIQFAARIRDAMLKPLANVSDGLTLLKSLAPGLPGS